MITPQRDTENQRFSDASERLGTGHLSELSIWSTI